MKPKPVSISSLIVLQNGSLETNGYAEQLIKPFEKSFTGRGGQTHEEKMTNDSYAVSEGAERSSLHARLKPLYPSPEEKRDGILQIHFLRNTEEAVGTRKAQVSLLDCSSRDEYFRLCDLLMGKSPSQLAFRGNATLPFL